MQGRRSRERTPRSIKPNARVAGNELSIFVNMSSTGFRLDLRGLARDLKRCAVMGGTVPPGLRRTRHRSNTGPRIEELPSRLDTEPNESMPTDATRAADYREHVDERAGRPDMGMGDPGRQADPRGRSGPRVRVRMGQLSESASYATNSRSSTEDTPSRPKFLVVG